MKRYAVIRTKAWEEGKVFIAPDHLLETLVKGRDRLGFATQAYNDDHVLIELNVVGTAKGKPRRGQ